MGQDSEVYFGLDTSKLKISVAISDAGRDGEVRFFGDIDSSWSGPHFDRTRGITLRS